MWTIDRCRYDSLHAVRPEASADETSHPCGFLLLASGFLLLASGFWTSLNGWKRKLNFLWKRCQISGFWSGYQGSIGFLLLAFGFIGFWLLGAIKWMEKESKLLVENYAKTSGFWSGFWLLASGGFWLLEISFTHGQFGLHVNETNATATFIQPMCTKPMPRQHFSSRCPRNQCHSNISLADAHETHATATLLQPMSTKPMPQQHFSSRSQQNQCHGNISPADVHETFTTATFLESNVRPLCLAVSGTSLLLYAFSSSFSFVMFSRSCHSLPVDGLLSGLGGYRVALTIKLMEMGAELSWAKKDFQNPDQKPEVWHRVLQKFGFLFHPFNGVRKPEARSQEPEAKTCKQPDTL